MIAEQAPGIDVRYFCGVPDVSELPWAYKKAATVRGQIAQFGLAEIVDTIEPIGNIMALGFSLLCPGGESMEPEDIRLVLECPFCGRPVPYPGPAAAGSDFSPGPFDPRMGIQGMVTRI